MHVIQMSFVPEGRAVVQAVKLPASHSGVEIGGGNN